MSPTVSLQLTVAREGLVTHLAQVVHGRQQAGSYWSASDKITCQTPTYDNFTTYREWFQNKIKKAKGSTLNKVDIFLYNLGTFSCCSFAFFVCAYFVVLSQYLAITNQKIINKKQKNKLFIQETLNLSTCSESSSKRKKKGNIYLKKGAPI